MANVFIKPTVIAATALGLLQREIVLPAVVWTNGLGDFAGAFNDTITVRIPARTTARRRTLRGTGGARNITLDTLTENAVAVQLTEDIYSAVPVTDEELTLDIRDFGLQILTPQVRSVVEGLENDLAATIQGASYQTVVTVGTGDGATFDAIIDGRKALNVANVDMNDRVLVVGPGFEAALLKDPQFARFDHAGDSTAFRDATVGKVAGLNVVTSNALRSGEAYMFHRSAFILATRAPNVPDGAPFGSSQSAYGLGLRWLRDYDATTLSDRSIVDMFAGYAAVSDPTVGFVRGVQLKLTVTGITVIPSAAAIVGTGTKQLQVLDSNGFDVTATCTYVSGTTAKATVNSAGLVTGVAAGTSLITATAATGGFTSTCLVTVS